MVIHKYFPLRITITLGGLCGVIGLFYILSGLVRECDLIMIGYGVALSILGVYVDKDLHMNKKRK